MKHAIMQQARPCLSTALAAAILLSSLAAQDLPRVGSVRPYRHTSRVVDNPFDRGIWTAGHVVTVPGSSFLMFELENVVLDGASELELTALADGSRVVYDAALLRRQGMHTIVFRGGAVRFRLWAAPGTQGNRFGIRTVAASDLGGMPEDLCGTDDRVRSRGSRVARLWIKAATKVEFGTAFLTGLKNCFGTAGHNFRSNPDSVTIEFDVPSSTAAGSPVPADPEDQYLWDDKAPQAIRDNGAGDDWAVIHSLENAKTGLWPGQVQQSYDYGPAPSRGARLYVAGHGKDDTPKTASFVQQSATGPLKAVSGTELRHRVDTRGGNSGSPVTYRGKVVAIHTHGGCDKSSSSYNSGTLSASPAFKRARDKTCPDKPDLSIRKLSPPSKLVLGAPVTITIEVQNLGPATAPASELAVHLSPDSDVTAGDHLLGKTSVPAIRSRAFVRVFVRGNVPTNAKVGTCWLGAFADSAKAIDEVDETDNLGVAQVTCDKGTVDLTITGLTVQNGSFKSGDMIEVNVFVRNAGTAPAPSSHCGLLIGSHTNSPNPREVYIGGFETGPIAPGRWINVKQKYRLPSCVGFQIPDTIGPIADLGNAVAESNERNNERAANLRFSMRFPSGAEFGFVPRFQTVDDVKTSTVKAKMSGKTPWQIDMCLYRGSFVGNPYLVLWSGSSQQPVRLDAFSHLSLMLLNTPILRNWWGKAHTHVWPSLDLPSLPITQSVTIWHHAVFFDSSSLVPIGSAKQAIELTIDP